MTATNKAEKRLKRFEQHVCFLRDRVPEESSQPVVEELMAIEYRQRVFLFQKRPENSSADAKWLKTQYKAKKD